MNKLIDFITFEEFQKLMKAEKKKEYKMAYALGFGSGLRISEIVGFKRKDGTEILPLTRNDVLLQEHQVRIRGAKGKKDRVAPFNPYLNEQTVKILPLKIPRRTLQDHFTKLCIKILGKPMNFHSLRHGFGNYMANEKNMPLPMLQSLMGHSRIDTTGIYTKCNPKQATDKAWEFWK